MASQEERGSTQMAFTASPENFFPVADVVVELPDEPTQLGPVFEPEKLLEPLLAYSDQHHASVFGAPSHIDSEMFVPTCPVSFSDKYLYPSLSKNEYLRLNTLWYYTQDLDRDSEMQTKFAQILEMVRQFFGWEIGIIGIVEANTFTRLVTANTIPRATIPRRESPCSHTINQHPGTVFSLTDMSNDWRFRESPPVKHGGLRSYAGTQVHLASYKGETVVFGSICLASTTVRPPLTNDQKMSLIRAANLISSEIAERTRMRRQNRRQAMKDSLHHLRAINDVADAEAAVLKVLSQHYPESQISIVQGQSDNLHINNEICIPLTSIEEGLWEDTKYIEAFVLSGGTLEQKANYPVRAIVGHIKAQERLLLVACTNIKTIFDGGDVLFVDNCAQLISTAYQAKYLTEALSAKENFLSSIRHELRTPIHGILTSVELLSDELKTRQLLSDSSSMSEPSLNAFLQTIRSSGTELMTTVNNILRLNAIASYKATSKSADAVYNLQCVEADLLSEILVNYPEESLTGVSIQFASDTDISVVSVDWETIKEILKALIFNSLTATPNGKVELITTFKNDERRLTFDVIDTGIGIHKQYHERIFLAFEKVQFHSKGVGIGLNLARLMASALNGRLLLVSSEPGSGSHFRLEIPDVQAATVPSNPISQWPSKARYLPSRFHVVQQSNRNLHLLSHLEQFLVLRGFSRNETSDDAILIMNEPDPLSKYDCNDLRNLESPHMVFVVTNSPSTKLRRTCLTDSLKPHLPWLIAGPMYVSRLDEILLEADTIFGKLQKPLPVPHQPDSETKCQVKVQQEQLKSHSTSSSSGQSTDTPPITPNFELEALTLTSPAEIPPIKALLVDDNRVNLSVLEFYCKKRKFPYGAAVNGNQAITTFCNAISESDARSRQPFTLVLMDLQMPECDGAEATRRIREFEKENKLPRSVIFMITGQDSVSDRQLSFDAGVDEFFTKPVAMKRLTLAISRYFPDSPT